MQKRRAAAFTIVELLIVITVITILAVATFATYSAIQRHAQTRAAQSDLTNVAAEMERSFQKDRAYPTQVPASIKPSNSKVLLTLKGSGATPYYGGLSEVQNGVLLSQICTNLINENVGKGADQGGTTREYITGCGNWNHNSMQITGWATRVWATPVTKDQLLQYASSYTVGDAYHKSAQETAVKNFYTQLVSRLEQQGGRFPVTSFWDYWADPGNGGVMLQPLSANPATRPFYCVEAATNSGSEVWHVDQSSRIQQGNC